MPQITAPAYAGDTVTQAGQPTAAQTVTVAGVVYTFRASVTTTANEILIGASAAATLTNLLQAINLVAAGSGVTYGSLTVINPEATAVQTSATVLTLKSKIAGSTGNFLTASTNATNYTVATANFTGGTGNLKTAVLDLIKSSSQVNSDIEQVLELVTQF